MKTSARTSRVRTHLPLRVMRILFREFHAKGCVMMLDWLRVYNLAYVIPFVEAVDETQKQYYLDETDLLKDVVSIPGMSVTYVLNKALRVKGKNEPDL